MYYFLSEFAIIEKLLTLTEKIKTTLSNFMYDSNSFKMTVFSNQSFQNLRSLRLSLKQSNQG